MFLIIVIYEIKQIDEKFGLLLFKAKKLLASQ